MTTGTAELASLVQLVSCRCWCDFQLNDTAGSVFVFVFGANVMCVMYYGDLTSLLPFA